MTSALVFRSSIFGEPYPNHTEWYFLLVNRRTPLCVTGFSVQIPKFEYSLS